MATHYTPDDREAALKLYGVNHLEPSGVYNEAAFWLNSESVSPIPTGTARDDAFIAAGTHLGVTVDAASPWLREQQFWAGWLAKPPIALA